MELSVKLQEFEGPLDLLLHLIDKNKVNIFDIPIAAITDQYMEYLRAMEVADMGVMSEFLVMAATLLDIKSRMLLPPETDEEGEEVDPRQELVERLLEHKLYRYMSDELRSLQKEAGKTAYREPDMPKEVLAWRPKADPKELLSDVTLERLNTVFCEVMRRKEARTDPVRSTFGNVEKEEVDLGETIAHVERYITKHKRCSFRSLLAGKKSRMQLIITFLTVLELMKTGKIEIEQEALFSDIQITAKEDLKEEIGEKELLESY